MQRRAGVQSVEVDPEGTGIRAEDRDHHSVAIGAGACARYCYYPVKRIVRSDGVRVDRRFDLQIWRCSFGYRDKGGCARRGAGCWHWCNGPGFEAILVRGEVWGIQ